MSFTNHYYQGGYDYDFVEELQSHFECPICLLCIRDPYQTSCGHRFCHSCILTWLQEGRTCPHDNCSLGEGDIFPDAIAHRQILQLLVRCPLSSNGCSATVRLSDVERHFQSCQFKQSSVGYTESKTETCKSCGDSISDIPPPTFHLENVEGARAKSPTTHHQHKLVCPRELVACPFAGAGCIDQVPRSDLALHNSLQTPHHLNLLWEKLLKMQQIQGASCVQTPGGILDRRGSVSPTLASLQDQGPLERGDVLRLSGSNLHSTQKLIRDLFHRMVTLEQKMRQIEISNERLLKRVSTNDSKNRSSSDSELLGRFCNGEFVWKIEHFSDLHEKMRHDHTSLLYSSGFYTSVYGYKICLRCNVYISKGEQFLTLFVHLMKGLNDDSLEWPFAGKIVLKIINQDGPDKFRKRDDFCETIHTPSGPTEAFKRPAEDISKVGFGLHDFVRINSLYSGGFVSENDCVIIKAFVLPENTLTRLVEEHAASESHQSFV